MMAPAGISGKPVSAQNPANAQGAGQGPAAAQAGGAAPSNLAQQPSQQRTPSFQSHTTNTLLLQQMPASNFGQQSMMTHPSALGSYATQVPTATPNFQSNLTGLGGSSYAQYYNLEDLSNAYKSQAEAQNTFSSPATTSFHQHSLSQGGHSSSEWA